MLYRTEPVSLNESNGKWSDTKVVRPLLNDWPLWRTHMSVEMVQQVENNVLGQSSRVDFPLLDDQPASDGFSRTNRNMFRFVFEPAGSLRPFVYLQNFEVSKRSVIYIIPGRRTPSGDDPALAELRNRTLTGAGRAIHHGGRTSVNGLFSFSVD